MIRGASNARGPAGLGGPGGTAALGAPPTSKPFGRGGGNTNSPHSSKVLNTRRRSSTSLGEKKPLPGFDGGDGATRESAMVGGARAPLPLPLPLPANATSLLSLDVAAEWGRRTLSQRGFTVTKREAERVEKPE